MRCSFFVLAFLLCTAFVFAQQPKGSTIELLKSQHLDSSSSLKTGEQLLRSIPLAVPLKEVSPFLSYSLAVEFDEITYSEELTCWIRFSESGKVWTDWQSIERDEHNSDEWTSQVQFTDKAHRLFQYEFRNVTKLTQARMNFYSPGASQTIIALEARSECNAPAVVLRGDWCPNGRCPENPNASGHLVSHIIIHHSAGTNNANDWAAIVRAIWNGHVNTNGWSDIGYNWLIDPNGVLYEGRGADIRGAHFCGKNTGTEGVCIIGNFQNRPPTEAALSTLSQFLAWRTEALAIDPLGLNYHTSSRQVLFNIAGHQDGCATACPGQQFYPMLDEVRTDALFYRQENCETATFNNEIIEAHQLTITPNPFQTNFQLTFNNQWKGTIQIRLLNLQGQVLYNHYFEKTTSLFQQDFYLPKLTSGLYLLTLSNGTNHITQKVVHY